MSPCEIKADSAAPARPSPCFTLTMLVLYWRVRACTCLDVFLDHYYNKGVTADCYIVVIIRRLQKENYFFSTVLCRTANIVQLDLILRANESSDSGL